MDSDYGYRFSERALQDFDDILHYISVELTSQQSAQNLGKKIFESIDVIRAFPKSGTAVDNEFLPNKTV